MKKKQQIKKLKILLEDLEEKYNELDEEIQENIEDAEINNYSYYNTNEYKSKDRHRSNIYYKILSIKNKIKKLKK